MILRQATAKDLDRIYQITFDAFGPYCAAEAIKKRYGIGGGIADKAKSVRGFCEQHLNRVLVAEEGGQVVGYYSSIPHEEYGIQQLAANAVDPAYQGRGIGTRMARHVVRELIEIGIPGDPFCCYPGSRQAGAQGLRERRIHRGLSAGFSFELATSIGSREIGGTCDYGFGRARHKIQASPAAGYGAHP